MELQDNTTGILSEKSSRGAALAWFVCCIAAVFYCYAYVLRMYPSVMVSDLREHFHISATVFGSLAAFYYYSYTPMQLAVGVIIDRFGARLVLVLAALLSTLGMLLFVVSHSLVSAEVGRFVMGIGAAFAYVTVLKLATLWLPPKRFAMMAGLTTSLGMIAAMSADVLLTRIVQSIGYIRVLHGLLILGCVLVVVVAIFVRNRPKSTAAGPEEKHHVDFKKLFRGLGRMFAKPQMWLIGIIGMLLYLPASVFLDTWGIPYMVHVYHFSMDQAGDVISMVFLGWIVASPLWGVWSDHIRRRKLPLIICALCGALVVTLAFCLPHPSDVLLHILFFLFGAFCGVHPLVFSLSRENNPNKFSGTSIAVTNAFIMCGGFLQPVVGMLLDAHWAGKLAHGIRIYTPSDYSFALMIIPAALILVTVLSFFLKETHCQLID